MPSITVDTGVWLKLLDRAEGWEHVESLLDHCGQHGVQIHYSSRVINFDTVKMRAEQQQTLSQLLTQYGAQMDAAGFRLGELNNPSLEGKGSFFGGPDTLSDLTRESTELQQFEALFKVDPVYRVDVDKGNKLGNWIGDYDSLKNHFVNGRDIYVTLDTKIYFTAEMRAAALQQLGIRICDPIGALAILRS